MNNDTEHPARLSHRTVFYESPEIAERLRAAAAANGLSLGGQIRRLVRDGLREDEPQKRETD